MILFPLPDLFLFFQVHAETKRNKVKVRASDFPSLLYPKDGYDPDDVEDNLLKNPIAVRVCVFPHQINFIIG